MALSPKKTKFRKQQKGNFRGLSKAGTFIAFGDYGIQAMDRCWITAQQIEACRITISRTFSRKGQVWIRVFPDKPVSKKPAETRMGTGKGAVDHYVVPVKPGRILFEVSGITREEAQLALRLAAAKLPLKTKFVDRVEGV